MIKKKQEDLEKEKNALLENHGILEEVIILRIRSCGRRRWRNLLKQFHPCHFAEADLSSLHHALLQKQNFKILFKGWQQHRKICWRKENLN